MTSIWIAIALLAAAAAGRQWHRLRGVRSSARPPRVDDAALAQILERGSFEDAEDEPLDMDEAARAEEEFWRESWEEPDDFTG